MAGMTRRIRVDKVAGEHLRSRQWLTPENRPEADIARMSISASPSRSSAARAELQRCGVPALLRKPIVADELRELLRRLLDKGGAG